MMIRWIIDILIIIKIEMRKLKSLSSVYCIKGNCKIDLTLDTPLTEYTNILYVQCFRARLHNDANDKVQRAN